MHASRLLRKILVQGELVDHVKRVEALPKPVQALPNGASLSATTLGRAIAGRAYEKHRIKRVDVRLSNELLHAERVGIYRDIARRVIAQAPSPLISVDWSDTGDKDTPILRASVSLRGRGFVLWKQAHPRHEYNSDAAHTQFMKMLYAIIPEHCTPVIITDAFLHATRSWVETLFSRSFLYLVLTLGIAGLYLAARQWDQFTATFLHFFNRWRD